VALEAHPGINVDSGVDTGDRIGEPGSQCLVANGPSIPLKEESVGNAPSYWIFQSVGAALPVAPTPTRSFAGDLRRYQRWRPARWRHQRRPRSSRLTMLARRSLQPSMPRPTVAASTPAPMPPELRQAACAKYQPWNADRNRAGVPQLACEAERIRRHDRVPVVDIARWKQAAQAPGVYIIQVDGNVWYVGVAERSVYLRIKERMKTLRDFSIPSTALANRTVAWISIVSGSFPSCSIGRRDQRNPSEPYRPLKGVYAVLKILEQYFIKTLGTAAGKGNELREPVVFAPGGSLTIHEDGKRYQSDWKSRRIDARVTQRARA
jgi:hypothetical protein